jgi:hypothetical protein
LIYPYDIAILWTLVVAGLITTFRFAGMTLAQSAIFLAAAMGFYWLYRAFGLIR